MNTFLTGFDEKQNILKVQNEDLKNVMAPTIKK